MNDFTKEELIDIYDALMDTSIAIYEDLPSKVQSMIDNYCEHELCDIDYDYQPLRCRSCKEVVE